MRLRGRAGNFCHRSIDLIELVTILSPHMNTNDLDICDYRDFQDFLRERGMNAEITNSSALIVYQSSSFF